MKLFKNPTILSLRKGEPIKQSTAMALLQNMPNTLPQQVMREMKLFSPNDNLSVDLRQQVLGSVDVSNFLPREQVLELRATYTDKRIKLIKMFDDHGVEANTTGLVNGVDDAGQLMVAWDNNRTLSVNFDAGDMVEVLSS